MNDPYPSPDELRQLAGNRWWENPIPSKEKWLENNYGMYYVLSHFGWFGDMIMAYVVIPFRKKSRLDTIKRIRKKRREMKNVQ